jgi:hypothetical protein
MNNLRKAREPGMNAKAEVSILPEFDLERELQSIMVEHHHN